MSRQMWVNACVAVAVVVSVVASGCAPAPGGAGGPKVAPVKPTQGVRTPKQGEVATGAGSLEAVRRQLEGTWALASLEVPNASGALSAVTASGRLVYDAYGNFDLTVRLDPAAVQALGAAAGALDLKGRAVIDVSKGSFRVLDVAAEGATPRAENVARVREYQFEGETLALTAKDAAGRVTSRTTWRRQP